MITKFTMPYILNHDGTSWMVRWKKGLPVVDRQLAIVLMHCLPAPCYVLLSKCCAYDGVTALPAVFSTMAVASTYTAASMALIEGLNYYYNAYFDYNRAAMLVAHVFTGLVAILAGPLYVTIMRL